MNDRIGQQFGKYRLSRLLGQGGFAEVYLGEHIYLKTQAALKLLHGRLSEQDTQEFLQEAQTLAKLKHPHIVRVYDFGLERHIPYIVMDYAPNGTLHDRHPRGTMVPLPQILSYVRQVGAALAYTHERKLIHRDVKPENMLLDEQNQIQLSDFGIAAIAHRTASMQIQTITGTVRYMAPEQLLGLPTPASDQYSLGILVYEWLCGESPFHGATFVEIGMKHATAPVPSLQQKVPTLIPEVEQVVLKALAKDEKQRFLHIQDFVQALEHAAQSRSVATTFLPPEKMLQPSQALPAPDASPLSSNQALELTLPVHPISSSSGAEASPGSNSTRATPVVSQGQRTPDPLLSATMHVPSLSIIAPVAPAENVSLAPIQSQMANDHDLVKKLQELLKDQNPYQAHQDNWKERWGYDSYEERLDYLDLSELNLSQIPSSVWNFTALETLILSENQLSSLPPEISTLTALKYLYMDSNQLTLLPMEIGIFSGLKELNLSKNQLTSLPSEVGNLTALQVLDLSDNQLTSLPPEVGQLSALERLWLNGNRLSTLPAEVGYLKRLTMLTLDDNPLHTPLHDIIEQGTTVILTYLRDLPQ